MCFCVLVLTCAQILSELRCTRWLRATLVSSIPPQYLPHAVAPPACHGYVRCAHACERQWRHGHGERNGSHANGHDGECYANSQHSSDQAPGAIPWAHAVSRPSTVAPPAPARRAVSNKRVRPPDDIRTIDADRMHCAGARERAFKRNPPTRTPRSPRHMRASAVLLNGCRAVGAASNSRIQGDHQRIPHGSPVDCALLTVSNRTRDTKAAHLHGTDLAIKMSLPKAQSTANLTQRTMNVGIKIAVARSLHHCAPGAASIGVGALGKAGNASQCSFQHQFVQPSTILGIVALQQPSHLLPATQHCARGACAPHAICDFREKCARVSLFVERADVDTTHWLRLRVSSRDHVASAPACRQGTVGTRPGTWRCDALHKEDSQSSLRLHRWEVRRSKRCNWPFSRPSSCAIKTSPWFERKNG